MTYLAIEITGILKCNSYQQLKLCIVFIAFIYDLSLKKILYFLFV